MRAKEKTLLKIKIQVFVTKVITFIIQSPIEYNNTTCIQYILHDKDKIQV